MAYLDDQGSEVSAPPAYLDDQGNPLGSAPPAQAQHAMLLSTDVTPDYLSGVAGDFAKAGVGAAGSGLGMLGSQAKSVLSDFSPSTDSSLETLTKDIEGKLVPNVGLAEADLQAQHPNLTQARHVVGKGIDYLSGGYLPQMLRIIRGGVQSSGGHFRRALDSTQSPSEALAQVLEGVTSVIPGQEQTYEAGDKAVGFGGAPGFLGFSAGGSPQASGDLGLQLGLNMGGLETAGMGPAGRTAVGAAKLPFTVAGKVASSGLPLLLSSPEDRVSGMFPDSGAAEIQKEVAIPDMLKDGVMASSVDNLVNKLRARARNSVQNLKAVRENSVAQGTTTNAEKTLGALRAGIEDVSPKGVDFSKGYTAPAEEMYQNVDTLARGGAAAVVPPAAPPQILGPNGQVANAPKWTPPPRGPIPVGETLQAYDALRPQINEAAYSEGKNSPRTNALLDARGGLADSIKEADPKLGRAMEDTHAKLSGEELGNSLNEYTKEQALLRAQGSGVTRRVGAALAAGAIGGGAATGHLPVALSAAGGAAALYGIQRILASPAWKTVSSVAQSRVASLLKSGQVSRAAIVARAAINAQKQPQPPEEE